MQALEYSFSSLGDEIWDPVVSSSMEEDIPQVVLAATVLDDDDDFLNMADELDDTLMMESPEIEHSNFTQSTATSNMIMEMMEEDEEKEVLLMTPPAKSKGTVGFQTGAMGRMPRLVSPNNSASGEGLAAALHLHSDPLTSQELKNQYMGAMRKLAESMKKSEVTRKQILQYRQMSAAAGAAAGAETDFFADLL